MEELRVQDSKGENNCPPLPKQRHFMCHYVSINTYLILITCCIAKYTVDIELTYLSACHDRKIVALPRQENIIKTEIMI